MDLICEKSTLRGAVNIPGSKSHTIRAVAVAALAGGESVIRQPLESRDAAACVAVYRAFGADLELTPDVWRVQGLHGEPRTPENVIDVGNSGTSLRIAMGSAALLRSGMAVLTGDQQIRRRPGGPLAGALTELGARVRSTRGNGCAPFVVEGRLRGGRTAIEAATSQYLSSLLLAAPLADGDTEIEVTLLNEAPYVVMTLDWLEREGIVLERDGLQWFRVPGGQRYPAFDRRIPGDFSSATFFLAAGALEGNNVLSRGLDLTDVQGDKAVLDYLRAMGAEISEEDEGVRVRAKALKGTELDLNATPDALPMMAVLGCFAEGTTRLVNVPQARLKETDRIAVMRQELTKLGAQIEELADGLVVHQSRLHGGEVDGQDDHRVVMALAVGATRISEPVRIRGYEAAAVTYPGFAEELMRLGGAARIAE
ncbi:MAG: 3-phosphoshikimate 1-carboxyvinyltransferase [Candidatus Hydrogenedentes bacterium]|nr:3-phosphoshikimate 1-carboxyvinyltransferase [Candidatus Hydrogenedentota bacterium]